MRFLLPARSYKNIALLLLSSSCRPNPSVPSTNSVEALRGHARQMAERATSGDRIGVAEYREAAAAAYARACSLGDESSCRQTVRYWASVNNRSARRAPAIDARTAAEVDDPYLPALAQRSLEEIQRAWRALATLSVQTAVEQSRATHDVTPLLQVHREFAASNIEEPAFYAVATSDLAPEPSRRYLETYAPNGVTAGNEHAVSVRRHLAEIDLREVIRSLREAPGRWDALQRFVAQYPELYIEEPTAFQMARSASDVEFIAWYRQRYGSVQGMGAHVAAVRERHAAVILTRSVDAMCAQPANLRLAQLQRTFPAEVAGDFRETAAWPAAATRALACAREADDEFKGPLLEAVASIFSSTASGREASAAHETFRADAALRSRDLNEMRTFLGSDGGIAANVARVTAAYLAALRRSRGMSAEELQNYRDVFDEDSDGYRQVESLRASAERREAAAQEREEAQERRRECSECVRTQQQIFGGSSEEFRSTVCGQACGVNPERACSNCVRRCVSEGIASPAECRSMACMGACN